MILPGARGEQQRDHLYDASGTITTGGTAQLLLPEAKSRSYLFIQNPDPSHPLTIEFGGARATVAIAGGALTTFTITNAGFGYTVAPLVRLLGGGNSGNPPYLGVGMPGYPSPGDPAYVAGRYFDMSTQKPGSAHAVLTAGAVSSIVVDAAGSGYQAAPYVFLENSLRDPFGAALPSATVGMLLLGGGGIGSIIEYNGTACPTDAIAIFGATNAQAFVCKYIP